MRIKLGLLLTLLLMGRVSAQGVSEYSLIYGTHKPLVYEFQTGAVAGDTLDSAGTVTTQWVQIGVSPLLPTSYDKTIINYNPEIFTVVLILDTLQEDNGNVPDSVGVKQILFELALDTTETAATAMDSTHIFLKDGNYNHLKYGDWMYEDILGTLAQWRDKPVWMNIRVPCGAFIRFKLTHPSALSANLGVKFTLILIGEN